MRVHSAEWPCASFRPNYLSLCSVPSSASPRKTAGSPKSSGPAVAPRSTFELEHEVNDMHGKHIASGPRGIGAAPSTRNFPAEGRSNLRRICAFVLSLVALAASASAADASREQAIGIVARI